MNRMLSVTTRWLKILIYFAPCLILAGVAELIDKDGLNKLMNENTMTTTGVPM